MKFLILTFVQLLLIGCKKEISTNIKIVDDTPVLIKTLDEDRVKFLKGISQGTFVVDNDHPNRSYLQLNVLKNDQKIRATAPMRLPPIDTLLGSTDPLKLESKTTGQNFGMMVMRQMRSGDDLFTISFHDKQFNNSFGQMIFEFEPDKVHFDEDKKEFLFSYQKVIRKQRATIIKVDSDLDDMFSLTAKFGWLEKTLDHIVNYSGAALVSPWAYARYSKVKWIIGASTQDESREEIEDIKEIIKNYPVIDYFAFVHGGDQALPLAVSARELGLKKNQLRVVYTGACLSGPGDEWLKNYGAVAAAGTLGISASPLFQFSVMRKFVYGFNFEEALIKSYKAGVIRARALEWITFAKLWQEKHKVFYWKNVDDMLRQSEIQFSHTEEMPAKDIYISQSAILSKVPSSDDIITIGVIKRNEENALEAELDKAEMNASDIEIN